MNNTTNGDNKDLFQENVLTRKITLPVNYIKNQNSIINNLTKYLNNNYSGKCIEEGYILKNSIKIMTYSNGMCKSDSLEFSVVFNAFICHIFENMIIDCKIESITKAGFKCSAILDDSIKTENLTKYITESPIIVFCARDHHYDNEKFTEYDITDNNIVRVRVLGSRYELNDEYISVIGVLI